MQLTEGDVITIFSQYGEVMDINMPREKDTGKKRGFGFIMYEDQRSTVLAVDNLNGAKVLDRMLRVDHVRSYKQPKEKGEDGEMYEAEQQSLNAAPKAIVDEDENDSADDPDLEDPMAAFLSSKRKSGEDEDDLLLSSEERARRKEEKRRRKEERELKRQRKAERRERREDHKEHRSHQHERSHDRSRSPSRHDRTSRPRRDDDYERERSHRDRERSERDERGQSSRYHAEVRSSRPRSPR